MTDGASDKHFDAIIVGSGFGGSVTAYRLAEAGLSVCVLERGKAYPPGEFPRAPHRMQRNIWDPSEGLPPSRWLPDGAGQNRRGGELARCRLRLSSRPLRRRRFSDARAGRSESQPDDRCPRRPLRRSDHRAQRARRMIDDNHLKKGPPILVGGAVEVAFPEGWQGS